MGFKTKQFGLILGEPNRGKRGEGEKKKKRKRKRRRREEEEFKKDSKIWNLDFCMDSMILVWIYGILTLCMGNGLSQKLGF